MRAVSGHEGRRVRRSDGPAPAYTAAGRRAGHVRCCEGWPCTRCPARLTRPQRHALEQKWPQTLWIVRHGQSAGNVARDAAELGGLADDRHRRSRRRRAAVAARRAAGRRARRLVRRACRATQRPEIVLSSPYVRARQTADRVLDALHRRDGAPPAADDAETIACVRDERLREKEFGILDRLTPLGIRAKYPELAEQRLHVGKFYFRPPGGESWCDVILRLRSFLDMLTREYRGDRVLVVAHQVIVNCLRYLLERLDEAQILAIDRLGDVPNCGVTSYEFDPHAGRRGKLVLPARELRLAAARGRRAGHRRARRAGRAEIVMAEIGATVEIDAPLLRGWPLPEPDGDADKEERGSTLVIAGSARDAGRRAARGDRGAARRRRQARRRDGRARSRAASRSRSPKRASSPWPRPRPAARPPTRMAKLEARLADGRRRAGRPRAAGRRGDARLHAPRPQAGDARRRRRRCAGDGRGPRRAAASSAPPLLTPHAGEMAHLTGVDQGSGEPPTRSATRARRRCAGTPSSP